MIAPLRHAQVMRTIAYSFGDFRLDLATRTLDKSGARIPIQDQPLRILILLLEHWGKVVTRESLRAEIWPSDTFVDFEQGLNTAIRKLRRALADDRHCPNYVETVPRHGYRFIAKIQPELEGTPDGDKKSVAPTPFSGTSRPAAAVSGPTLVLVLTACVLVLSFGGWGTRTWLMNRASASTIHSVAVLPFVNLSGDSSQDYLVDGLTDALITDLAQIHSLKVISRTSAMVYKGTRKPLEQIAKELAVDVVVEGTVSESDGQIRVNAQLIRGSTDTHLWAGEYEGSLRDVLVSQNDVSRQIAERVEVIVAPGASSRSGGRAALNPKAYEYYLRGRFFWDKRDVDSINKAIASYQQSLSEDPQFAQAYAGLADAYTLQVLNGYFPQDEAVAKAKAAAVQALHLDDNLAEAHTSLAAIAALYDWDWTVAEKEFKRALEINPSDSRAHHWYGQLYFAPLGRLDEALAETNHAHELDPLSEIILTDIGFTYYLREQYQEALKAYQRALELDPEFEPAHFRMGETYEQLRRYGDLGRELSLAYLYTHPNGGERTARSIQEAYENQGYKFVVATRLENAKRTKSNYDFACSYMLMGKKDQAMEVLAKGVAAKEPILIYLGVDPHFDSLRSDSRFQELLRVIGIAH